MGNPRDDAKGQYAPSQADRKADGVHSAKPTVITGSEDATVHNKPPVPEGNKQASVDDNGTSSPASTKA